MGIDDTRRPCRRSSSVFTAASMGCPRDPCYPPSLHSVTMARLVPLAGTWKVKRVGVSMILSSCGDHALARVPARGEASCVSGLCGAMACSKVLEFRRASSWSGRARYQLRMWVGCFEPRLPCPASAERV
jgi:hypothetical protein